MDKENQKISVRIGGMSYNLVSSESEQYTRQIAARADEMIRRVAMSSPLLSQQMTIILALTNAVDELTRQALQQSQAEKQRDTAETKAAELRTELAKARELNWEMKKELLRLNALCHQQEVRLNDLEKQTTVILPVVNGESLPAVEIESIVEDEPMPEPEPEPEPGPTPVLTGRRTLKTIGELRQTGLEEYLSMYDQPKDTAPPLEPQNSTLTEIEKDDES